MKSEVEVQRGRVVTAAAIFCNDPESEENFDRLKIEADLLFVLLKIERRRADKDSNGEHNA